MRSAFDSRSNALYSVFSSMSARPSGVEYAGSGGAPGGAVEADLEHYTIEVLNNAFKYFDKDEKKEWKGRLKALC